MLAVLREAEAIIRGIAEEGIPVEGWPDACPEAALHVLLARTFRLALAIADGEPTRNFA